MVRGLSRLLYEHALRPDDDEAEKLRKRISAEVLPPLAMVGAVLHLWLLLFSTDTTPARYSSMISFGVVFDLLLAYMIIMRRMPLLLIEVTQLILTGIFIVLDWALRAVPDNTRSWLFIVLIMDFLLSVNAGRQVQMAILAAVTLWLAVFSSDEAYRWGLLSIEDWVQPSDAQIADMVGCANPPCARGPVRATTGYIVSIAVLYADYFATRRFAEGQRRQLDVVRAAVRVSSRVAWLLAAYATDDARRVVADEGAALPEPLRDAYTQLLDNLDSYRVFLPDSILYAQQQQYAGDSDDSQDRLGATTAAPVAPGLGQSTVDVAICFTDIQSSTELWDASPQGMFEGLEVHNCVMRRAYAACGGYEVKTIGDSFMVAFHAACDAVRFGLTAQQQLLRQHWPENLMTHPLCKRLTLPDGEPLWGGLRVRIGLHSGEARVDRNPVTGRCDYFGTTVNIAARLESLLRVGGSIAASDTVAGLITGRLAELGSPVLHELGHRHLKGVRDKVLVWVVLPRALAGRLHSVIDLGGIPNIETSPAPILSSGVNKVHGQPHRPSHTSLGDSLRSSAPYRTQARGSLSSAGGAVSELDFLASSCSRRPKKLSLTLQASSATCAVVWLSLAEMSSVPDSHPRAVAAACLAVDRTHGTVEGVISACVTVTWNAVRPCADHVAACRQFLTRSLTPECHLGAASGRVLSGSFSAGRRSFTTVIGGAAELSSALAEEAAICGDHALAAGAVAEHCEAAGLAHWAQMWIAPGSMGVVVMAVMQRKDQEADDKWVLSEVPLVAQGWQGSIAGLFHKACAGGPRSEAQLEVLAELQRDQPSPRHSGSNRISSPRRALAARIERGAVRTRHVPALWQPALEMERPASVFLSDLSSPGAVYSLTESSGDRLSHWTPIPHDLSVEE